MAASLRYVLLSFFVFAVTSSSINAAPTLTEDTEYYNIQGTTWKDLREQMKTLGTKGKDGKTHSGYNDWHISWRFQYNSTRGRCTIASVKATVKITYTLPKWIDRSDASEEMRVKWDKYTAALIKHEQTHTKIAVQAATEIEQAIAALRRYGSCDELGRAANALGHRILAQCKDRQVEYDSRTDHGRLEGPR